MISLLLIFLNKVLTFSLYFHYQYATAWWNHQQLCSVFFLHCISVIIVCFGFIPFSDLLSSPNDIRVFSCCFHDVRKYITGLPYLFLTVNSLNCCAFIECVSVFQTFVLQVLRGVSQLTYIRH